MTGLELKDRYELLRARSVNRQESLRSQERRLSLSFPALLRPKEVATKLLDGCG